MQDVDIGGGEGCNMGTLYFAQFSHEPKIAVMAFDHATIILGLTMFMTKEF
jgi:hypothetical protein